MPFSKKCISDITSPFCILPLSFLLTYDFAVNFSNNIGFAVLKSAILPLKQTLASVSLLKKSDLSFNASSFIFINIPIAPELSFNVNSVNSISEPASILLVLFGLNPIFILALTSAFVVPGVVWPVVDPPVV